LVLMFILGFVFTGQARASDANLSLLSLPDGFDIEIWAEVPGARSLAVTNDGTTVYVGTRDNRVYRIRDEDQDRQADTVSVFARNLNVPNGIALDREGRLYIAEQHQISRFDREGRQEVVVPPGLLPDRRHHGWRYIGVSPDGALYVSVGAPCNICKVKGVEGTILKFETATFNSEIFAEGVRNSVGFDWHPKTGELFFTDNGGDNLGDDIPPDELNHAPAAGQHFGYPFEYDTEQAYPQFKDHENTVTFQPPVLRFGAHVAALGIDFYSGAMFPDQYRQSAIVAQHGSWNRSEPVGYRLLTVVFEDGKPVSKSVLVEGWLQRDGEVLGRPVDIAELPDGSLLVSDDHADVIYRITYSNNQK
ncbi:MAG: PQQ-dependent sugar dehydrogenase, partial [Sneathiella sp.]